LIAPNQSVLRRSLTAALAILVLAGALYSAFLFFGTVRAIVARTELPFAETVVQAGARPEKIPEEAAVAAEPEVLERVNILLLGIDQRDGDNGPWRTDTMILASIDPATHSAALLSIPRDLWVTIPGFGENRINAAHLIGDQYDYPGGGTALAKKTVWHTLGVPVHGYVRINFSGFERMVDAIGGLTVEVETAIHDEEYPDGHYGTMVVDIPAGVQEMDGVTALQYVRSRHGTGDFDRMARQQNLIMAARDKVMSLDIPLSQLPEMLAIAGDTVKTDLSLDQMRELAAMAQQLDRDKIDHSVIDSSMTTTVVTPEGWMVEVPEWDAVREMVDQLFPVSAPAIAPTPSLAVETLDSEGARIVVQNGTLTTGLAEQVAGILREQGFNVVAYENAERFDHASSLVVLHGDQSYTAQALAGQCRVSVEAIIQAKAPRDDCDIVLILGRDYAQSMARD